MNGITQRDVDYEGVYSMQVIAAIAADSHAEIPLSKVRAILIHNNGDNPIYINYSTAEKLLVNVILPGENKSISGLDLLLNRSQYLYANVGAAANDILIEKLTKGAVISN